MSKYDENMELIRKAVRCEPVDRVPVVPCANAYYAKSQGVLLKDYISDFDLACETNLKELKRIGADGTQNVIFSPLELSGFPKHSIPEPDWVMTTCGRWRKPKI